MHKTGTIYGINGPVIYLKGNTGFQMAEMVYVGKERLVGEVIRLTNDITTIQVFEETTGLRPGEKLYEEVLSDKENTIPTENKKIMIAKVRHYEYTDILETYGEFERLSRTVKIMDTVKLMKKVVPEFKSKNSPRFEVLDK